MTVMDERTGADGNDWVDTRPPRCMDAIALFQRQRDMQEADPSYIQVGPIPKCWYRTEGKTVSPLERCDEGCLSDLSEFEFEPSAVCSGQSQAS